VLQLPCDSERAGVVQAVVTGDKAAGAALVAAQRVAVLSNIYRELLPRRAIYTAPFEFAAMSNMPPMTTTSPMAPRNTTAIQNTCVVQSLTAR
jgi:hypothetical protein